MKEIYELDIYKLAEELFMPEADPCPPLRFGTQAPLADRYDMLYAIADKLR